jgi:putative addiction module CopG family antidote
MPYSTRRTQSNGLSASAVDDSFQLTKTVTGMGKVITPHFEKLIDRFVASERFNNKSEVIRAGLRLPEEHEASAAAASRDIGSSLNGSGYCASSMPPETGPGSSARASPETVYLGNRYRG